MKEEKGMTDTADTGYSGTGYIVVNVFTARGALPIEGALVTIIGDDKEGRGVYATVRTNKNGNTPKIPLPAPCVEKSLKPDNLKPYATYIIEIDQDGYYSQSKISVSVFCGITSIQPAELSPIESYNSCDFHPLLN